MSQEAETLKAELTKAESQLAHVSDMIAGQQSVIQNWARHGWDTKTAMEVLDSLEQLQQMQVEYRDRVSKKIESSRLARIEKSQIPLRL